MDNSLKYSQGLNSSSRRSIGICRYIFVVDIVIDVLPPCWYHWLYIRRSTPLTILWLLKPAWEFTYVTASSSFACTIDSWVLTHRSINYLINAIWLCCDIIAIGDNSNGYELIWSQLSMNRFLSPIARESAFSYTHWVCYGWTIMAQDRTLNLTTLYVRQIYSDLHLSSFAIYRTESILRHSGNMNPKSGSPSQRECGWTEGWFV